MPTVSASNLPYIGTPTIEPEVASPGNYQTPQATPQAFGSQIGAEISDIGRTLGQGADKAANFAIEQQRLANQVAADDKTNQYMDAETKILLGDPNTPGDTGFFGKHGEAAMRAFPDVRDQLVDLRNSLRGGLTNPRQQIQFDQETRRMQAITLARMGEHYDREYDTYATTVNKSKTALSRTGLAAAAADGNDEGMNYFLGQAMKGRLDEFQRKGVTDPNVINEALQEERGYAVKTKTEALSLKNPLAALTFLNNNSDAVQGDELNQLRARYRARADGYQAQVDAGLAPPQMGDYSTLANRHGSPRSTGWGELAAPVIDEFRKQGASEAFIEGAMANGLAEGGFKQQWERAWRPDEESYGHWQLHRGGELDNYEANRGTTDSRDQARFLMKRMQEISQRKGLPDITKTDDAKAATDLIGVDFENYKGRAPGQRYGYLQQAQAYMHDTAADRGGTRSPSGAGDYLAVGDSIAAHLIRKAGVGGNESGKVGVYDKGNTAVSGWQPHDINRVIENMTPEQVTGKDVALSTGFANLKRPITDKDMSEVHDEVTKLFNKGAKSIRLLGVGDASFYSNHNQMLSTLAADEVSKGHPVVFAGPLQSLQADHVHTTDPQGLFQQIKGVAVPEIAGSPKASAQATPTDQPYKLASSNVDNITGQPLRPLPSVNFAMPALDPGELPDAQVPGMAQALEQIQKNVPADDPARAMRAVQAARKLYNGQYQQQQQEYRMHQEQINAQSSAQEKQYQARIYPGSPNPPTQQEIAQDKFLKPEAQRTITSFMERADKQDPAAEVSKQTTMDLYKGMNLPDTDPNKITTDAPIKRAYIDQKLTKTDLDWITNKFEKLHDPGHETVEKTKAEWIKAMKVKIEGIIPSIDKEAGVRMFNYQQFVDDKVAEYQGKHLNWRDLFNPANPAYLGSADVMKNPLFHADSIEQIEKARTALQEANGGFEKMTDDQLMQEAKTHKDSAIYDRAVAEFMRRHPEYQQKPPDNNQVPIR